VKAAQRRSIALAVAPAIAGFATLAVAIPGSQAASGGLGYEPAPAAVGDSLSAPQQASVGRPIRLRGTLTGVARDTTIEIQRLDPQQGWVTATSTVAGREGSFDVRWTPAHAGRTSIRAIPVGGSTIRAAGVAPSRGISVYKISSATWYGPGLWGNALACGRKLRRGTIGVAHRTLPCGTQVELRYRGRTVIAPVVDRGPFRSHAEWDLTYATAKALRFKRSARIGALRITAAKS
jgi:hypothetical protein